MSTPWKTFEFSDRDADLAARLSAALNRRYGESTMPHRFEMEMGGLGLYRVTDIENGAYITAQLRPNSRRNMVRVISEHEGTL